MSQRIPIFDWRTFEAQKGTRFGNSPEISIATGQNFTKHPKTSPRLIDKVVRTSKTSRNVCCTFCKREISYSDLTNHLQSHKKIKQVGEAHHLHHKAKWFARTAAEAQALSECIANSSLVIIDAGNSGSTRSESKRILQGQLLVSCLRCKDAYYFLHLFEKHSKHCLALDSFERASILPFRILPPDLSHWRQAFKRHLEQQFQNRQEHADQDRFDFVFNHFRPKAIAFGCEGWSGYAVFIFDDSPRVLLESACHGHAAYVINGDWQSMVHLSRAVIREEHRNQHTRIVHTGNWQRRLYRALSSQSSSK